MTDAPPLRLHEEVLLLGLHAATGELVVRMTPYAMAGGILAELLLAGRVRLTSGRRALVEVVAHDPLEDEVLERSLERIATAHRRASLPTWIARLGAARTLVPETARNLAARGILHEDERRVLGLFPARRFPERDPGPERALVERIERVIVDGERGDERTLALIALAYHGGALAVLFGQPTLSDLRRRIEESIELEEVGTATRDAIWAVHAAMAALIVAVT